MQLVLATNNRDKIREIKHLLEDLPVTILTADDFLDFPDPDETGATLEDNALIKAKAIAQFADLPALADDSGLEVDALGGAPGVYSSRFAGDDCTYEDNNRKLLDRMKSIPDERRTARFRCVICIYWGEQAGKGDYQLVDGVVDGIITRDLGGKEGFGYDPVFYYPEQDKRFSEMNLEEKNAVSHRGRALTRARDVIIERLNAADS